MINRLELAILLNGADRDRTVESIASLIAQGEVSLVIDQDVIAGIRTTQRGDERLQAVTLPACHD